MPNYLLSRKLFNSNISIIKIKLRLKASTKRSKSENHWTTTIKVITRFLLTIMGMYGRIDRDSFNSVTFLGMIYIHSEPKLAFYPPGTSFYYILVFYFWAAYIKSLRSLISTSLQSRICGYVPPYDCLCIYYKL